MNKKSRSAGKVYELNQTFNNIKGHPKNYLVGIIHPIANLFIFFHSFFIQVIEPTIHTPISGLLPQNAISNGYLKQGAAV